MESFYSVIYYKANPLTDELVSIGFFCGGGEGPFLFLSEHRLKLVKRIIHNNSFLALNRNLKSLEKSINQYRNNTSNLMLFDPVYTIELFDKLCKKSKGSVLYSPPTSVNEWMTNELFEELTIAFLGESSQTKKARKRKPFHIKWKSVKKAKRFSSLEKDILCAKIASNLTLEIKIDLFDKQKNKAYKALDFDSTQKTYNLRYKDVVYLLNNLPVQLTLISPRPRTKIGKGRLEEMKTLENAPEILTADELMSIYD